MLDIKHSQDSFTEDRLLGHRVAVLAEGCFGPFTSKTAASFVRYRPELCVAVIDSSNSPGVASDVLGNGSVVPIVPELDAITDLSPTALLIGVATQGGMLPRSFVPILIEAIKKGLMIINGLHERLVDVAELVETIQTYEPNIWEVRTPPDNLVVGTGRVGSIDSTVVLTVGSDCRVGKRTAAWEVSQRLISESYDARFVPTGQTGVMISGGGTAIDAIPVDFLSGVVEHDIIAADLNDYIVVEGQGTIFHPAFSGLALGLLHGAQPDGLIMCHAVGRDILIGGTTSVPPLDEIMDSYLTAASWRKPTKFLGVALNCAGISSATARLEIEKAEDALNLPVVDVIQDKGAKSLAKAIVDLRHGRNSI